MFGKWKHFFAWILIIAMTFNVLPMSAFATAVQEEMIGQEEVQQAEQKEYKLFEANRDDYFYVETLQVYAAASDWEIVESDYETCPEIIGKLLDMETYIGYEVSLIDHDESTPVYSNWEMLLDYDWMLYVDGEIGELAVYRLAKDGTVTKLEHEIVTKTYQESVGETIKEYTIDYIAFQSDEVGSFFYGESVATEKLASLEIVSEPTQTKYFKQAETPELNLSGLEVQVTYEICSEDGEVLLTETKELKEGEYSLAVDMSETGTQEVVVSYGSDENMVSDSFEIEIFEEQFEEPVAGVSVNTEHPGITNMKVVKNHHHPAVVKAMSAITDQFRSYDITLEGYEQGEKAAVTMRIPVGFTNPVIYYVDMETAKAHFIPSVVSEDGKSVTFFTDHFSTYVIAEEEGLPYQKATVQNKFSGWVLTNSLQANKEYLIASSNAAGTDKSLLTRNGSSIASTSVEIKSSADVPVYIDDADVPDGAKWTASGSSSAWYFKNGNYWLRARDGLTSFSLNVSTTNYFNGWKYNDNRIYYDEALVYSDRYISYSNNQWSASTSAANVYLYEFLDIDENIDYWIRGNDLDVIADAGEVVNFTSDGYKQVQGSVAEPYVFEAQPTYTRVSGDSVINFNADGTYTYTGEEGTEIVQVTIKGKTESGEEIEIYDQFRVTVKNPDYRVDIRDQAGESITRVIPIKNVFSGKTYNLDVLVEKYVENETEIVKNPTVQWSVGNSALASVDGNGVVTFSGVPGSLYVTASYRVGNSVYEDTIVFSISDTNIVVPEDGTEDFPEYPNEGSVRFDKTATAVGSFSQTGVVQVELSMTGVPINDPVDVVLLLDMSGSMTESYVGTGNNRMTRYDATIQAAQDFVETLVLNENGTYNENRVHVITFHGNAKSTYSDDRIDELTSGLTNIKDAEKLRTVKNAIKGATAAQGTYYSAGLKRANTVLANARNEEGYDRKQFVVFMSDGAPMGYTHINGSFSGTQATTERDNTYATSTGGYWTIFDYKYNNKTYQGIISAGFPKEKYSEEMKNAGVTIYTVGLGIADDSYSESYTGTSTVNVSKEDQQKIINNISSYPNDPNYAIQVDDAAGVAALRTKFKSIATSIKYAAEDVKVEDKIKDDFTMVFDWPENVGPVEGYEQFYIEVVDYPLDADHNRNEEHMSTLMRLYVGNNPSTGYYAADAAGKKLQDPTYSRAKDGEKAYYALENREYVFKVNGDGTHNLTDGALVTGKDESSLVLRTPYFYYDASTRMLYWTTERLSDSELAMRYFLYLDESAGFDADDQVEPGTYDTNDYAYLYYRNHLGNDCRQKFPEPQVTWNGAQVSYTFYLVNEQGQPVNHAGRVVPFAEAVYVTDVFTHAITWNDVDETTSLDAVLEAQKLLPEVYELYDKKTAYMIHVFEDENGSDINNHFKIDATTDTTYVFNTKADAIKYTAPGIYGPKARVNCKEYSENGVDGEDNLGKYDWVTKDATVVKSGFDFANTTVAFAVVWKPELRPDTVVIDFGLPVVIDVAQNDSLVGDVVGVRSEAPEGVTINTGQYSVDSQKQRRIEVEHGIAYVDGIDSVRYVPKNMEFDEPDVLYYESEVGIVDPNTLSKEYYTMYSSVTVIPATSIYYEDRFVQLESGVSADNSAYGTWVQVSDGGEEIQENGQGWNVVGATQAVDRPGPDKIGQAFDADNIYGYDGAYDDCTKYSMGSSKKVTVNAQNNPSNGGKWPTAAFTFTGTDFDIIGLSSNRTGILCVTVTGGKLETPIQWIVDTYYGYQYVEGTDGEEGSWEVVENGPNTLYQVPVIKSNLGTYGTYTVTLEVRYGKLFDHSDNGEYDFYLDAIRVYNPAKNNKDIQDVYVQDSEYKPTYYEVRNHLIGQNAFSGLQGENASSAGIVFIDGKGSMNSVADYTNYGPNNEVYLTSGQAINFVLSAQAEQGLYNRVHMAMKSVGAATTAAIYKVSTDASGNGEKELVDKIQLNTSTDLYYDMTPLLGQSIIVENCSAEGILSLTNVKVACGTEEVDVIEEEWVNLEEPAVFAVSRRSVDAALYAMNRQDVQEPEEKPENTVSVTEHFSDVKDDWYTSSVQYVFDKQIMKGISGTNEFQPSKEISRAEIAQILYNLEGKPERKNEEIFDMFKDVNSDAWYADAVSWAYEHNIIKGDRTEQRFSPNDSATREQVAQILYRYASYKGYDVSQTSDLENLLNVEKVSSWASAGVAWAVGAGVIKGVTNVEESGVKCYDLAPQGIVTRAQAAMMMMRFCERYQQ